jgi:AcrR family transcriptional regulator
MARPLSEAARTKMLEAAEDIIDAEGVNSCTVDEVSRRSGVARTTIYRHFGNTDGLVLAVVDRRVRSVDPPDTGSLRGDLDIIVAGYLAAARVPNTRRMFAWMLNRSINDPEFTAKFRNVKVQPQGATVIALQRAMARGEIDPDLPLDLAMHLVQGPFMSMRIIENTEVSDEARRLMVDAIVRGLQRQRRDVVPE